MSYDVGVTESYNYTSNMAGFFEHYIRRPFRELDGMPAFQGDGLLTVALVRIAQTDARDLQKFDADNGWGQWISATEFLRSIRDDCRRNPTEIVEVSD